METMKQKIHARLLKLPNYTIMLCQLYLDNHNLSIKYFLAVFPYTIRWCLRAKKAFLVLVILENYRYLNELQIPVSLQSQTNKLIIPKNFS